MAALHIGKIPPAAREQYLKWAGESEANFSVFRDVIYPGLAVVGDPQAPGAGAGAKPPKNKREKLSGKSSRGIQRAPSGAQLSYVSVGNHTAAPCASNRESRT